MIFAFLLHGVYSTTFAFVLAHLFGGLHPWSAGLSLLLGTYLGVQHARPVTSKRPEWSLFNLGEGSTRLVTGAVALFVLYAAWRHFAWMLFPSEFHLLTLSQNNLGDLPLHINFIRAFSNGIAFPPRNPIFPSELLRYPYGADLYNALWESVGVRLEAHLFLTGIFATLASLVLLRSFAGWWGMGAFFLSGGLAGWQILNGAALSNFQDPVAWKNLFLAVFITQRGMLFALPIGLALLIAVRAHFSGERVATRKVLTVFGILWGILPLFHLHAFLIVSIMIFAIAVEYRQAKRFHRFWPFIVAVLPATYFVLHSTGFFKASGIAHWRAGWTIEENQDLVEYLLRNFGPWLFLPIAVAIALFLRRKTLEGSRKLALEFATYSALLALFFNLILAPWEWDNIKLLIWPYLGFARLAWVVIDPILGRLFGGFERPVLAVVLFASGVVNISWTLQTPTGRAVPIYGVGTLASVQGALSDVPANAVFAASPTYQHPLTYFGRLRVVGYNGHVWSHGLDGGPTYMALDRIFRGDPDAIKIARSVGVTHIFWGPDEKTQYGNQDRFWMTSLKNMSRVAGYAIYEIK